LLFVIPSARDRLRRHSFTITSGITYNKCLIAILSNASHNNHSNME